MLKLCYTIREYLIIHGYGCFLKNMNISHFEKILNEINNKFDTEYSINDEIPEVNLDKIINNK